MTRARTAKCLVSSQIDLRVDLNTGGTTPVDAINQDTLGTLRELGADDFHELIRLFIDEAAARVARLHAVERKPDLGELAGIAHALRGTAGAFGALRLSALCSDVERAASDRATADLHAMVQAVVVEFDRVREALTKELT